MFISQQKIFSTNVLIYLQTIKNETSNLISAMRVKMIQICTCFFYDTVIAKLTTGKQMRHIYLKIE